MATRSWCVLVGPEEEEIKAVMQMFWLTGSAEGNRVACIDQKDRGAVYILFLVFRRVWNNAAARPWGHPSTAASLGV